MTIALPARFAQISSVVLFVGCRGACCCATRFISTFGSSRRRPGRRSDQTARVMQQVLQRAGVVHTSSVENISRSGRHDWPCTIHRRRAWEWRRRHGLRPHHARRHRHALVSGDAPRGDAHRAADGRIRSHRSSCRVTVPIARRSRPGRFVKGRSRSRGEEDRGRH